MRYSYSATAIFFIVFAVFWFYLRKRKAAVYPAEEAMIPKPLPLKLGLADHCKALLSWIFLFMRVFSVRPGLYWTGPRGSGEPGKETPVLVTCNNFLSIFLLARRIGERRTLLLVVDTDGINVWCSAGKGRFSAGEVLDKALRSGLMKEGKRIKVILPKFSLSGVNLGELKKSGIHGIIGPLYASDVPAYLDAGKYEDRINDRVHFGLRARGFTALPTAVQFLFYFSGAYVVLFGFWGAWIVWSATLMAFFYPILLPYLPGRWFATKGVSLGFIASAFEAWHAFAVKARAGTLITVILFLFATSIFIGLSYTGNSAISNYSKVRKEIVRFLPVVLVLYLLTVAASLFL